MSLNYISYIYIYHVTVCVCCLCITLCRSTSPQGPNCFTFQWLPRLWLSMTAMTQNSMPATSRDCIKALWSYNRNQSPSRTSQSFVSFYSSSIQAVYEFQPRKSCTKSVTASDWGLVPVSLPQLKEGVWLCLIFIDFLNFVITDFDRPLQVVACAPWIRTEETVNQTMAALEAKIAFVAATRHIEEQVGRIWEECENSNDKCIAVAWRVWKFYEILAHGIE